MTLTSTPCFQGLILKHQGFFCLFYFVLQRAHCVTEPFQQNLNGSTPSLDSQYVIVPCR